MNVDALGPSDDGKWGFCCGDKRQPRLRVGACQAYLTHMWQKRWQC